MCRETNNQNQFCSLLEMIVLTRRVAPGKPGKPVTWKPMGYQTSEAPTPIRKEPQSATAIRNSGTPAHPRDPLVRLPGNPFSRLTLIPLDPPENPGNPTRHQQNQENLLKHKALFASQNPDSAVRG